MSREFQLVSTEFVQDHYFRFDAGIAQDEKISILLNQDIYVSQIVIQTENNSQVAIVVRFVSGSEYTIEGFSSSATEFYLNDGNGYILWNQLPKGTRLEIRKVDVGSSGILEVAVTTRSPMRKPPEIFEEEFSGFSFPLI